MHRRGRWWRDSRPKRGISPRSPRQGGGGFKTKCAAFMEATCDHSFNKAGTRLSYGNLYFTPSPQMKERKA